MTVKVTHTIVFNDADHPLVFDFVSGLDKSVIADFPEFESEDSMLDIYTKSLHSHVLAQMPEPGLISTQKTVAPNGLSAVVEEIWESLEEYAYFSSASVELTQQPSTINFPVDAEQFKNRPVAQYLLVLFGNQYSKFNRIEVVEI